MTTLPDPPLLRPIERAAPPRLPVRWHAIAMLTPFENAQIVVAEVWYDWDLRAMLVVLDGLEEGHAELLYVESSLFLVVDGGARVIGPFPASDPVPAPDWLADKQMSCQGEQTLLGESCEWWVGYSPCTNGYQGPPPPEPAMVCNWVLARIEDRLPWRFFFTDKTNPCRFPVLGAFPMTNFTLFEAVVDAGLTALVSASRERAEVPATALNELVGGPVESLLTGLGKHVPTPEDSGTSRAQRLIPGLKPAPADTPLPSWPDTLYLTAFSTPTAKSGMFPARTLPTRVYYEWPERRQLTRCYLSDTTIDDVPCEDLILNASTTYLVIRQPDGSHVCKGTMPVGLPKPNWAEDDKGTPRAIIEDNPQLSPGRTTRLSVLRSDHGRVFWVWYTADDRGVLFMEVPQLGDVGLVLTDYYAFEPGTGPFDPSLFVVPADCMETAG